MLFKAARLKIHAKFHDNFENVFECVILSINQKEQFTHHWHYKPGKLPKCGQNMHK
jgi:hypothetical protein